MNSKSMALLFLAAATIFLAGTALANNAGIPPLCGHTEYPILCSHMITEKDTPASATTIAMERLLRKSTAAKSLTLAFGAHTGDDFVKQLLDTCKENYDDAITSLESSMKALKSGDKAGLNTFLSAAMSDFVTCNDGFSGEEDSPLGNGGGHPNPLSKFNARLVKLASTALALSAEIH